MEKRTTQSLKQKLTSAVNSVLKENKTKLTDKMEKTVNKSIKKIVRKADA